MSLALCSQSKQSADLLLLEPRKVERGETQWGFLLVVVSLSPPVRNLSMRQGIARLHFPTAVCQAVG